MLTWFFLMLWMGGLFVPGKVGFFSRMGWPLVLGEALATWAFKNSEGWK